VQWYEAGAVAVAVIPRQGILVQLSALCVMCVYA